MLPNDRSQKTGTAEEKLVKRKEQCPETKRDDSTRKRRKTGKAQNTLSDSHG